VGQHPEDTDLLECLSLTAEDALCVPGHALGRANALFRMAAKMCFSHKENQTHIEERAHNLIESLRDETACDAEYKATGAAFCVHTLQTALSIFFRLNQEPGRRLRFLRDVMPLDGSAFRSRYQFVETCPALLGAEV
jgi:hypothetical protein